eukprot:TRINITY_DN7824_c0_g1_i2.p1 TRINITY_DN7824_c0_g1~~TRINITY_DN7824_c0_g1_i2.p1  ORF type:complete len:106 (+),score=18.04 TRINITY_DN7824_c0_g1_i2:73-390(+)
MEVKEQDVSVESLTNNNNVLHFIRICILTIAGCIAGIMGLTGLWGFLSYAFFYIFTEICILSKMKFQTNQYFPASTSQIFMDGVTTGLLSFILFWTLMYNIVHIY